MNLQERLRYFRTNLNLSYESIAKELTEHGYKIVDKTIAGYESGLRQPSVAYLTGLADVFDGNPMWLLLGIGEAFLNSKNKEDYKLPDNLDFNNVVFIPHVDLKTSAGYGCIIEEINMTQDFVAFAKNWLLENISAPTGSLVLFTVSGDSMDCPNSQIKHGSLILVDRSISELRNDGIYVVSIDGALFVKRLQLLPKKMVRVKSDNPLYDPFDVSFEDESVRIIGKVLWAGNKIDALK